VLYPWTNGGGGVMQFGQQVQAEASKQAPWAQWRLVMVEVDNKLPMYLQNHGAPFYYVQDTQDFPRDGDTAGFMAWLEKTSGQHWDPQRTLILTQCHSGETPSLGYLQADHKVISTLPDNGERLFNARDSGSLAYIPNPAP